MREVRLPPSSGERSSGGSAVEGRPPPAPDIVGFAGRRRDVGELGSERYWLLWWSEEVSAAAGVMASSWRRGPCRLPAMTARGLWRDGEGVEDGEGARGRVRLGLVFVGRGGGARGRSGGCREGGVGTGYSSVSGWVGCLKPCRCHRVLVGVAVGLLFWDLLDQVLQAAAVLNVLFSSLTTVTHNARTNASVCALAGQKAAVGGDGARQAEPRGPVGAVGAVGGVLASGVGALVGRWVGEGQDASEPRRSQVETLGLQ